MTYAQSSGGAGRAYFSNHYSYDRGQTPCPSQRNHRAAIPDNIFTYNTDAEARQTERPIALVADPALVTVWLGANDIVQPVSISEYEKQLEAMLLSLRQQTRACVYVGNIPDLSLLPFFTGYDREQLKAEVIRWNATITQAVTTSGAPLVDLYASWTELAAHPEYIAGDGFHPSTEGAKRLAEVFQSRIAPALSSLRTAAGIP